MLVMSVMLLVPRQRGSRREGVGRAWVRKRNVKVSRASAEHAAFFRRAKVVAGTQVRVALRSDAHVPMHAIAAMRRCVEYWTLITF